MTVAAEDVVFDAMKDVVDPELGINVVDLGLVYGVTVDDANIATVDMTLTSAACPLTDVIEDHTRAALTDVVADFRINWVWMPPWVRQDHRRWPRDAPSTGHQASRCARVVERPFYDARRCSRRGRSRLR
jgi:metal-sulfur cluster biosynthetic enzyme